MVSQDFKEANPAFKQINNRISSLGTAQSKLIESRMDGSADLCLSELSVFPLCHSTLILH